MAPFVDLLIVWNMDYPIALCRNDRSRAALMQHLAQVISIKSLVGQQCTEPEALNQVWHSDDLTALTGQQFETNKIAQRISEGQYFGC